MFKIDENKLIQWLGLCTFTAKGIGLIPGQGTNASHMHVPCPGFFFFLNKIDESSNINIMFGHMYMEVITKKASKIIKDGSKARE